MNNRILILCQYFYPEYVSSAMLPTQLAEELTKKGLNVNVICGQPQEYYDGIEVPKYEVVNGVNIHRVTYSSFNNKNKLGRIMNFLSFFISIFFQLKKIVKYEIVFVYSNPPILPLICYLASKVSKIKFIFVGFDLYPDNALALNTITQGGFIERLMKNINNKVFSAANAIVAISDDMKTYLLKKYLYLEDSTIKVIPNWYTGEVNITNIVKNEEFKAIREMWDFIVLYTGNMGEAQDLDTIVEAIIEMKKQSINQQILFIFTGHGSKRTEIEQRLLGEKIENVKFFGFLKGQDYIDILNISDICLVSLKRGIEGLGVPSKTYGYFAYGKPVIAIMSDQTELAVNINAYKAGASILQGKTEKFIELITYYTNNHDLLKESQQGSLKLYEELYKKRISIDKYYNLIKEIASDKGD